MKRKSPSTKKVKLPLPLSRYRRLAPAFRCLDCHPKLNTVIRGSLSDQARAKAQFICRDCNGTNIERNVQAGKS
jgi:hypothetical protein